MKGLDVFDGHGLEIFDTAAKGDYIAQLAKRGIWLNVPVNYGWTETVVGSGSTGQNLAILDTYTGVTANSSALLYGIVNLIQKGTTINSPNFGKKIIVLLSLVRYASDTEVVGRFQFKNATSIGALGATGLGIRIDNLALKGESYGTALGVVDLSTSLTSGKSTGIMIVHDGSIPRIDWYVDIGSGWILKGSQTTAANIPSGSAASVVHLVQSIKNGATGGVDARLSSNALYVWGESTG